MIPLLMLAAASLPLAQLPGGDGARFDACLKLIKADPQAAVDQASEWAQRSNDVPARQCLGLAFVAAERWEPATVAFEQAAQDAEIKRDGRATILWVQAGNAALGGDDPGKARQDLDRALALPTLPDQLRGEAWLDRARADVALGDLPLGRTDMDKALKLVPADPFAWLLSATLARRQRDHERAEKDIQEAAKLAPDDPAVVLEMGNIADARGQREAAKLAWTRAAQLGPGTPEGKAAAEALAGAAAK
jgi:tetratricopeptide (TPR) repeat protein